MDLPIELQMHILSFVHETPIIANCMLVCTQWHALLGRLNNDYKKWFMSADHAGDYMTIMCLNDAKKLPKYSRLGFCSGCIFALNNTRYRLHMRLSKIINEFFNKDVLMSIVIGYASKLSIYITQEKCIEYYLDANCINFVELRKSVQLYPTDCTNIDIFVSISTDYKKFIEFMFSLRKLLIGC